MKTHLRLKPSFHFRVSGPCEVKITMVAGKWVHMVVECDKEHEVKWGTTRKLGAMDKPEETETEAPAQLLHRKKNELISATMDVPPEYLHPDAGPVPSWQVMVRHLTKERDCLRNALEYAENWMRAPELDLGDYEFAELLRLRTGK